MVKGLFLSGIFFCCLSVIMGAFGAHALKDKLSEYSMSIYDKAVLYQFFHAFAILFVAFLNQLLSSETFDICGILFIIGILLFSGSLFILAITDIKWLGAITPLGGLLFIIAWVALFIKIVKIKF